MFALGGPTAVNCSVTDSGGDSDSGSFNVTVVDTTAPTLAGVPGNITVNPASGSQAMVTYANPTVSDIVDASPTVACLPASGSTFPIGNSTVTCTATDDGGNSSVATFDVFVTFDFKGFFSPIDNIPTVNTVKAGQSIPVKFSLSGDQGLSIFAAGSPSSKKIACTSGADLDWIEETATPGCERTDV